MESENFFRLKCVDYFIKIPAFRLIKRKTAAVLVVDSVVRRKVPVKVDFVCVITCFFCKAVRIDNWDYYNSVVAKQIPVFFQIATESIKKQSARLFVTVD